MSGRLRYAGSKLELEAARGVQCFTIKPFELPVKSGALMPNPSLNLSRYGMPRLAATASRWHSAFAASRVMPTLSG
jgi:hypothetical protein